MSEIMIESPTKPTVVVGASSSGELMMVSLNKRLYFGVGLVAMSTLMLELVLTRIFSVTLWYHFAFMAISVALLGIGVSGIYVYVIAPARSPAKTLRRLAVSAFALSITTVVALIVQLQTRFVPSFSPMSFLLLSQVYLVIAVPFFFGGLCISLVLTQFSQNVSKLYFADLVGAGIGCILVIPLLWQFTGPRAIVVAAILAALASWNFASVAEWRMMRRGSIALVATLILLLVVDSRANLLRIKFVKGHDETHVVTEKWNPFSRVVLQDKEDKSFAGWSLSSAYSGPLPPFMMIRIDAHAGTPMYRFDGNLDSVEALKYDSTSIAYNLKRGGKALIMGSGGGKDVLTALLFDMGPIYAVEINPSVIEIVMDDFADFSGRIYDRDNIRLVVDEARSYIARSQEKFDIIQASLVDSWAATAAGAFVLTENNLYTIEAFEKYYDHLTDDGILTISRVFPNRGGQTLRLAALGYEAWKKCGIKDPKHHMVIIRSGVIGTMLLKKSEFTQDEISTLSLLCRQLQFEIVGSPAKSTHPVIDALFNSNGSKSFYDNLPYNLEPPVDDKPFFFHMLRLKDLLRPELRASASTLNSYDLLAGFQNIAGLTYNDNAIFVLGSLLLIVTIFCVLFILGPLWTFKREALRRSRGKWALLTYFTCLGIGFMMVEVPLMQKLLLFLGHPIYALSVTLFSLLIFSGIGSYTTSRIPMDTHNRWLGAILASVSTLVFIYIILLPVFTHSLISIPTFLKVPLVVLAIGPLGFLMGMPFPMGIKLVDRKAHEMIPWVWGINGATSVFASVFSIAVAINFGFSAAMGVGLLAYVIASFVVHLNVLKEPSKLDV